MDNTNTPLGTGLSLLNPLQAFYTSYVDVTGPAPTDAIKAQIKFTKSGTVSDCLLIDNIQFVRVESSNLVQNHSFENDLTSWNYSSQVSISSDSLYEGSKFASLSMVGAYLFQDILLEQSTDNCCYLLNFGVAGVKQTTGDLVVEVYWLDVFGRELGIGHKVPDFKILLVSEAGLEPARLPTRRSIL